MKTLVVYYVYEDCWIMSCGCAYYEGNKSQDHSCGEHRDSAFDPNIRGFRDYYEDIDEQLRLLRPRW